MIGLSQKKFAVRCFQQFSVNNKKENAMNDLAIRIEHVSKQYRLGAIGGGTLKGDIQSFIARRKGEEDFFH